MTLFFIYLAGKEAERRSALVTMLIYGIIFAILWFVVYAIALKGYCGVV